MKINFKLFLLVSIFSIIIPISVVYAAQGTVRIYFPSGTTNPVGAQVTVVGDGVQAPAISTTLYPSAVTPPSATISTSPTSCNENCNVTVSWNSSNVENIVRIYRNGAFWINATRNAPGSATDWTLPAGTYEYCIRAVNNSWVESGNLACATTTVNPLPQNIAVSLTASPQTMTLPTSSTNLTWTTSGSPTSCTASGSWSGTKSATGGSEPRTGLTAGTYTYTITCSKSGVPNAVSSVTVTVNATIVNSCTGMEGFIKRDLWTGISGNLVTNLTSNANYPNTPNSTANLSTIKTTSFGDYYGQRIYGLIKAPATGQYRFYIASDDYSDLYLSSTNDPANKTRIAYVEGWTNADEWTKYTSQRSALISLVAGNTYFIEAIHKEGAGGDNVSVGWIVPGSSTIELISSTCLSTLPPPPPPPTNQCDSTWKEVPGSGYTPSQPVITYLSSTKNVQSTLLDSMVTSVRGTDDNVYLNICRFSGGTECVWGGWASVPGVPAQTTEASPYIWTGGTSFDLFIRNTLNTINYHKYNNSTGWGGWDNSGSSQLDWGKPFRVTDKLGRVWQVRKNADNSISYMCGATGCVTLPFNPVNSSFTPATANPADTVTVYCDYNASSDAIMVTSTAFTGCNFISFNGKTQARFDCEVGTSGGSHEVYCQNFSGSVDNVCSQSNSVGSINVNAPATPISVTLTANPLTMTLPLNSTQLNWVPSGSPTSCTLARDGAVLYTGTNTSFTNSGLTADSYVYRITCSKSGVSDATSQVTVTVNASTPTYSLNVVKSGQGTVTSDLPGIDCGSACTASYNQGTGVQLTASHDATRIFTGWIGGGCSGTGLVCNTTVNSNTNIIANFAVNPNYKEF